MVFFKKLMWSENETKDDEEFKGIGQHFRN